MSESLRVTELRRDIAEMKAQADHLDSPLTCTMLASLEADLAEALDQEQVPVSRAWCPRCQVAHLPGEHRTAPLPASSIRPEAPAPAAAPAPSPIHAAAPAAQESPMPRAPEIPTARLATLLERLKGNLAAKKGKAAGITRMSIRRHCALHGLPMPPEAAIQADTCPRKFRKDPKPVRTMPASVKAARDFPGAPFAGRMMQQVGDLGAPSSAAARLRALRSQMLEVLPELEDLEPEAARLAHEELRLLSEALVLGSHIIDRRIA